jgi:hypothetical protein
MRTFIVAVLLACIVGAIEQARAQSPGEQRAAYKTYAASMKLLVDRGQRAFPNESWGPGSGTFDGYGRCAAHMRILSGHAWTLKTPAALLQHDQLLRTARRQLGASLANHGKACEAAMRYLDGPGGKQHAMQDIRKLRERADAALKRSAKAMQAVAKLLP